MKSKKTSKKKSKTKSKKTTAKKATTKKAKTKKTTAKKTTAKKATAKKTAKKTTAKKAGKKTATKSTAKKPKKVTTSKKVSGSKIKTKKTSASKKSKSNDTALPITSKLAVGMTAPAFSLTADNGSEVELSQFVGKKNVLLYFYPKDDTPGCTLQACTFQNDLSQYESRNTVVLGVSADDAKSHNKFRNKYNLSFPLLIDADHHVAESYGVWVEKNMYGKKSMGIQRATFLIGKDGKLLAIWPKVKVEGHSEEVLAVLSHIR